MAVFSFKVVSWGASARRSLRRTLRGLGLAAVALALSGCAPASGGLSVLLLVAVILFGVSSCISGGETSDGDGTTNDDGAGASGDGFSWPCCNNGITGPCPCSIVVCNFSPAEFYSDGTCCIESAEQACPPGDVRPGGQGGTGQGGASSSGGGLGGNGRGGDGQGGGDQDGGGFGGLAGGAGGESGGA
jgi:hypothetical protein